jgi:hypothetical protein
LKIGGKIVKSKISDAGYSEREIDGFELRLQQDRLQEQRSKTPSDITATTELKLPTPFNPRTEVSADARHIARTMWTIFVLLPIILCILGAIASGVFTDFFTSHVTR